MTASVGKINLDDVVAIAHAPILFSQLEVEHWIGGIDAMLDAKTENIRERVIEAAKNEIERRGWAPK